MKHARTASSLFVYLLAAITLFSVSYAHAADYYVSSTGSDTNTGLSSGSAWKTISKVNGKQFSAGDRILFSGGQTFSGNIYLDAADKGSASNRITITSYGSGRATINGGSSHALYVYNTGGITLDNINFAGSGRTSNTADGVFFYADSSGGTKYDGITINNVDVSGFGKDGIVIGSWNGLTGYKNVSITNTSTHDNGLNGLNIYGPSLTSGYAHQNVYIGHVKAFNNTGVAGRSTHSGSGILIGNIDGGTIERSVAYNNGALNTAVGGPIGIWAYDSNDITIQYNEAHHNHTNSAADGGGFDLDGGITNSVMQYNYSHDNDGAGYGLYQYSGARSYDNNRVGYNISQNDGRKNSYGGISLWNGGSGLKNTSIYNNTVYLSASGNGSPSGINFMTQTSNIKVYNNIFIVANNLKLVQSVSGQTNAIVKNNMYWSKDGSYNYNWANISHDTPVQANPTMSAPELTKNLDNADNLNSFTNTMLLAGSPAINAGIDVKTVSINPGTKDFYGTIIPQNLKFDFGAHEYTAGAATTSSSTPGTGGGTSTTTATSTDNNPNTESVTPLAQGPWVGKYYTSRSVGRLSKVVNTKTDDTINFDWKSDALPVANELFGVEWNSTINFKDAGTYTFTAITNDGMRVWIDGKLLLDKWFAQNTTTYTFTRNLSAGNHTFEVRYYNAKGDAVAKLSWVKSATVSVDTSLSSRLQAAVASALDGKLFVLALQKFFSIFR